MESRRGCHGPRSFRSASAPPPLLFFVRRQPLPLPFFLPSLWCSEYGPYPFPHPFASQERYANVSLSSPFYTHSLLAFSPFFGVNKETKKGCNTSPGKRERKKVMDTHCPFIYNFFLVFLLCFSFHPPPAVGAFNSIQFPSPSTPSVLFVLEMLTDPARVYLIVFTFCLLV